MLRLLLFSCLIFLAACTDDDLPTPEPEPETALEALDRLVPATQEGANTFGCLINGKVWRNGGGSVFNSDLGASYWRDSSRLSIGARKFSEDDNWFESLGFSFAGDRQNAQLPNNYTPLKLSPIVEGLFGSPNYQGKYLLQDTTFNQINITLWTPNAIAGTFSFYAKHQHSQEILKITNGRFDVTYQTF